MPTVVAVLLGLIALVIAVALLPLWLPVAAVWWGVRTWRAGASGGRRVLAGTSVGAGVVLASVAWPALLPGGEDTPTDPVAAETTSSASPTTPAAPPTVTPTPAASATPDATPAPPPTPTDTTEPDDEVAAPSATSTTAETSTTRAEFVPVDTVSDGDTIRVHIDGQSERVRVIGLDAPEMDGPECYAQEATSEMAALVQGGSVRLEADPTQDDRDRFGRLLRHVFLEDGRSTAQELIAGGYAREYTYDLAYTHRDAHLEAESRAQAAGRGLWSACDGSAAPAPAPAPVAAPAPTRAVAAEPPAGACEIKGNINREGVRIYHVPGGGSYDDTVITESDGERWFCSREEAEAAGWRAARN